MRDEEKTREELIAELEELRRQIDSLSPSGERQDSSNASGTPGAREALSPREAIYRAILDGQTELICRFLPPGQLTYVNDAYCQYFGKTRDELIGHSFYPLVTEEDRAKEEANLASLTPENPVSTVEHRVIRPDGEVRWQQWADRAIYDDEGNLVEYQSVGRDITEWKRMEEEREQLLAIERAQRLTAETMARMTLALTSHLGYEDLLDEILRQAQRLVPSAAANIAVLEDGVLYTVRWRGYGEVGEEHFAAGLAQPLDKFPLNAAMIQRREPYIIYDTRQQPDWVTLEFTRWIRSQVTLPICLGSRVLGVLRLDGDRPGQFTEEDSVRLQSMAIAAAIALENARLYGQARREIQERRRAERRERRATRHLTFLWNAAMGFVEMPEDGDIHRFIAEQLHAISGALMTAVSLYHESEDQLELVALTGEDSYVDMISELVRQEPMGWRFTLAAEARAGLTAGRVMEVPGGLRALTLGRLSSTVCETIEKSLRVGRTYSMGLVRHGKLLGSAAILMRKGRTLRDRHIVETFVNQASEALQRKRAEEALRESERQYRRLVDLAPEPIGVHCDGTLIYLNAAGMRLAGATRPEEVLGRPIMDFIHPDEREIAVARIRRMSETGEEAPLHEYRFFRLDGTQIDVEIAASPLILERKPAIQVLLRDLTDRKRAEEELIKAQKLESLGILAGGIAHDFNNLLTGILTNAALVKASEPPDTRPYTLLSEVEKAAMRAKKLTQQLLTFSRGGAPVKRATSIAQLLQETALFALSGANVTCEFDLMPDLWPAEIDPGQISQVIQNLVINACQAMPQGGTIHIKTENVSLDEGRSAGLLEGRYVMISIGDEGHGIPPEELGKIFDPYFTTKPGGTGLGLATTYSIIKKHGGRIAVESERGQGTIFRIYLPSSAARHGGEESDEGQISSAPPPRAIQARILVMDDDETIRIARQAVLEHLGYEVHLAKSGEEVLYIYAIAQEIGRPFDAVIMDLTVPAAMGGRQAMEELLKIDPEAKALVASGYSDDPVLSDHRQYGFAGILPKPIEIGVLRDALHQLLDGGH